MIAFLMLTSIQKKGIIASFPNLEGFPSGQRGQTVNLLATPSEVQILPPPPSLFFIFLFYKSINNLKYKSLF